MRLFHLLCVLLSFFVADVGRAATLVVKLKASATDQNVLNTKVAAPAGLKSGHNYHVTLGIIVNVPKSQAKTLKKQLYAFLRQAHNAKADPVRFNVSRASTWGAEHNQYYNANTVILLPSNPAIFKSLNAKLSTYLAPLRLSGVQLDPTTEPPHYTAHITMRAPKGGVSAKQAVSKMNAYFQSHSVTIHLNAYRISIQ